MSACICGVVGIVVAKPSSCCPLVLCSCLFFAFLSGITLLSVLSEWPFAAFLSSLSQPGKKRTRLKRLGYPFAWSKENMCVIYTVSFHWKHCCQMSSVWHALWCDNVVFLVHNRFKIGLVFLASSDRRSGEVSDPCQLFPSEQAQGNYLNHHKQSPRLPFVRFHSIC